MLNQFKMKMKTTNLRTTLPLKGWGRLFLLLAIVSLSSAYSQVGIGTTTPQSILDIKPSNPEGTYAAGDGILIPRVTALPVINGVDDGELVYVNDIGFYYYNSANTSWVPLLDGYSKPESTFLETDLPNWSNNSETTADYKVEEVGSFTLTEDGTTDFNILVSGGTICNACRDDSGAVNNNVDVFTIVELSILDNTNTIVHTFMTSQGSAQRIDNIVQSASNYQFVDQLSSDVLPAGSYTLRLSYKAIGGRAPFTLTTNTSTLVFSPGRISGSISFVRD